MKRKAILAGGMLLPTELINVQEVKNRLSVRHLPMGAEVAHVVRCYQQKRGYLSVPRQFGLQLCQQLNIEVFDSTSYGTPVEFPRSPQPRNDDQQEFVDGLVNGTQSYYDFLARAHTGFGKCQKRGTPILMYDGTVKPVERVVVGDLLMGPDSTPRTVLSLARGVEEMFTVTPTKGDAHTFNRSHILSLKATASVGPYVKGEIVDVSIDDYLSWSAHRKHLFKLWRTGVDFAPAPALPVSPYLVGLYLGDGHKNNSVSLSIGHDRSEVRDWITSWADSVGIRVSESYDRGCYNMRLCNPPSSLKNLLQGELQQGASRAIPHEYLTASRYDRLQLLAGLLDTDGHLVGNCFEIICKDRLLADSVLFLARSLGLAAYRSDKYSKAQGWTEKRLYHRIVISGDTHLIPTITPDRKASVRLQKKSALVTGFTVASAGQGEYFGFELDGDRRYLLGDFTATHNTICALMAAARIGTTTLVIVDQDNLKEQWLAALRIHFGMTVENGHVGIIQGKVCDYEGRSVVIAMIHTLSQKRFPDSVYRWAGLLIVDEYHTVGAPTFSSPLLSIRAAYRFGVSATPRTDDLKKVLAYHLGEIAVAADKQHEESSVYFSQHPTVYSWYANISPKIGRILTEVSEDGSRNLLLAEATKWLYDTGRDVIVLSDRIDQLKHLMSLCKYLGIDPEVMGLYTGNHPQYRYAKDATPRRKPIGLVPGAAYTPVSLQLIAKTIPKKKLIEVKESALIQFATYGMAAKGYDVPRLSGGVDATPRSKAEQIHGRILREEPGKLSPIWFTVEDTGSYRLVRSFAIRAADYARSNARIYHWLDGELEEWQLKELTKDRNATVKHLQSLRIETQSDGRNTLLTKASEMQRRLEAVNATVERVRSRRRGYQAASSAQDGYGM